MYSVGREYLPLLPLIDGELLATIVSSSDFGNVTGIESLNRTVIDRCTVCSTCIRPQADAAVSCMLLPPKSRSLVPPLVGGGRLDRRAIRNACFHDVGKTKQSSIRFHG